ncbi:transcriptional regulator [Micromonospora sp. WMMD882]|uniref:transcriptional regulator n=1 Tax=Micromonospora sp. WMMD882 TaxID=3015151 RepID=UPI00248AD537|nr:transcriptional regulator [Micromonospora sp. WMMD882]WBB81417.1 transcriptional regulator [Micromonospora sp. WMMD882]
MSVEAVETARKRLVTAAEELDSNRVAGLVAELAGPADVVAVWEQVCVPLLRAQPGQTAPEIAVEHALSEGIRVGLDVLHRDVPPGPDRTAAPGSSGPTGRRPGRSGGGVLLVGADQEHHCLGLHALAAALRQRRRPALLLGPALPWPALADAVRRALPHTVVVWSQTPVTGRAYRLVRLGRDFPAVRVFGAGPGWIEELPVPVARLTSLSAATAACQAG